MIQVAILAGVATVLADEWAHRDELAARRFRELNPAMVAGEVDQSRNRRWHRVGFRQRLELVALAAGIVLASLQSWLAFGLAATLMGAVVSLVFDISFNIRFGQKWYYAGTTAWTDEWITKLGLGHSVDGGKLAAAVELLVVVGSAVAWLILV